MRILVVEDEQEIRQFLKESLEAECFVVDIAEEGERGSYLARTNEYDLMIIDYMLPLKDGLQICREIRAQGKNAPIIMISVKSEITNKVDLLNAGADDYITKPFSLDELLARIRALLRRPHKIEDEVLTIGPLRLDSKRHAVFNNEQEIYLTKKEFMLLEYLMRNQGLVLSRGMIMEHVWDMNADPFSNTIESHILSLRKKLSAHDAEKIIHTVQGRGYKLELR